LTGPVGRDEADSSGAVVAPSGWPISDSTAMLIVINRAVKPVFLKETPGKSVFPYNKFNALVLIPHPPLSDKPT